MHHHWDKGLNLKKIIHDYAPSHIVECGAGSGENTRLLRSLGGFKLTVISDNKIDVDGISFIQGVSYLEIPKLDMADMFIIDTDHNYWTLINELNVIDSKLTDGGLIALHDVSTYYHDTGMALSYSDGTEYPRIEIEDCGKKMGGVGSALIDFLSLMRFKYKLLSFTSESNGAAVIIKGNVKELVYSVPGKDAVYANQA